MSLPLSFGIVAIPVTMRAQCKTYGRWVGKQRMRAVAGLEMRTQVVASFEVSNTGGSIVVYVPLTVAPGLMGIVLWPPGEDATS